MTSISCSDIYGLRLKGKVSMFLEFWQRRRSKGWELIRLWLSSEVESCVLQGELDPLLPETVNRRCWPTYWWPWLHFLAWVSSPPKTHTVDRAVVRYQSMQKAALKKKSWWYFALLCAVRTSLGKDTSEWTTELWPADSTAIFIPGKVPFTLNNGIAFSFRATLCKTFHQIIFTQCIYSCTFSLHPAAES